MSKFIFKLIVLLSFFSCSNDDVVKEEEEFLSCFDGGKFLKSIENETDIISNILYNDECLPFEVYNADGEIINKIAYNNQGLIDESQNYSYYNGNIESETISNYTYNEENQVTKERRRSVYFFENGNSEESNSETVVEYNGLTNTSTRDESKAIYTIDNNLIVGLKSYEGDVLHSEYEFIYNEKSICIKIIGNSKDFVNNDFEEFKTIEASILYYDLPNVLYDSVKFKNNIFTLSPVKSAEDYLRDFITHQSKYYVRSMEIKIEGDVSVDSYIQDIEFDDEGYPLTISNVRTISGYTDFTKFIWE